MVPPNSLHRDLIVGENDLLPAEGQWNSFHLLPMQQILISARDRRCFFYVFRMPPKWSAVFALCGRVPWRVLGQDREGTVILGVRVCGMGWKFAIAYCQMAHRRMVVLGHRLPCTLTAPGGCSCLPEAQEVRRDRAVPVNGCRHARDAWSIYIDNLDLWEIFEQDDAIRLRGTVAPLMTAAEKCYHVWNSPGSPEDLADRVSSFKLLGVENDGVLGRRDVPKE